MLNCTTQYIHGYMNYVEGMIEKYIVRPRLLPKSLGCGKNFPGPTKLMSVEQVCCVVIRVRAILCFRLNIGSIYCPVS